MLIWAALNSTLPWLMFMTRHMALTLAMRAGMHLRCAYHGLIFRKVRIVRFNILVLLNVD